MLEFNLILRHAAVTYNKHPKYILEVRRENPGLVKREKVGHLSKLINV